MPTVLVATLAVIAMVMRVTTPLQLDMAARGVSLTVAGTDPVRLLNNSTVFSRLVIEGCDVVSFPPVSIGLADAPPLSSPRGLSFRCDASEPGSKVVLRAIDPSQELGSLGGIMANPGDRVSFEISGASPPDIRVEAAQEASFTFSIRDGVPFEIVSEFATPDEVALPVDADRVTAYRASLLESSAERLAAVSAGRGLNIVLVPARDADVERLFRADVNIPLESVSLFERSDVDDRMVSTVVSGTLTYPGQSDVESVPIEIGDVVTLGGLTEFRLTQLRVDREKSGLSFRFRGRAAEVRTGAEDRRLTLFDQVLFNRYLKILGIAPALLLQLAWTWAWARLRRYQWPSSAGAAMTG